VSSAEIRIQKQSLPEFEGRLNPYDLSNSRGPGTQLVDHIKAAGEWQQLTSCMKGALLTKITGHEWNHWHVSSTHDHKPAEGSIRPKDSLDRRSDEVLGFIFPKANRTFSMTSRGRDRTEQAMDTSSHIKAIIQANCTYEDSDEIIGELQFCYLTGMILGNAACMEHWTHMVKILFRAFRLVLEHPVFYCKFIRAVHAELVFDEAGMYGSSILDYDPDLRTDFKILLITFKSRLNEQLLAQGSDLTDQQSEVGKAFEELESWLWRWGWDLRGNYVRSGKIQLEDGEIIDAELKDFQAEDERGEFGPVVVFLDEQGREEGLIRF
jgi:A1 cistron-splicing factor AAR2